MKWIQPYDQPDNPTAPYVDLNESMGVDGSVPPAKFFNNVQNEILAVIVAAGLSPSDANTHQLLDAIQALMPTITGAPSDASLVHRGIDDGTANNVVLTITPPAAGVSPGFIAFFIAAADNTGASSLTVNLSPSGSVTKNLKRANGAALVKGDLIGGNLACAVCVADNEFRLAWLHNRGVVTDDVTIFGDGTAEDPLIAARSGYGVEIGQTVPVQVHIAGSFANPTQAGFATGQVYAALALKTGAFGAGINGNLLGVFTINGTGNTGSAASWPAPSCAMEGEITGHWRLIGWYPTAGVIGVTSYTLIFKRVD